MVHTLTRRSRHLSQALSVVVVPVDDSSAICGGVDAKQPSFVRRRLMRGEGKGFGSARGWHSRSMAYGGRDNETLHKVRLLAPPVEESQSDDPPPA